MAYTKTVWVDGSNPFTPASPGDPKINAANLNKIEQGIYDSAVSETVKNAIVGLFEKCAYIDTDPSIASNIAILESWAEEVNSITLSSSTLTFSGSGSQTLTATVDPVGSTVVWTSSDQSVATVSGGVVTSVGNGSCTITASAGGLSATCSVTVSGIATYYTIANTLSHVTNSNSDASVEEGSAYSATLTADTNYLIDSVTITMGGVDITAGAYSSGTVTIADVTGDIVIIASAVYDGMWSSSMADGLTMVQGQIVADSALFDTGEAIWYRNSGTLTTRRTFLETIGANVVKETTVASPTASDITDSTMYPITVPKGATSVTVAITPSTQFIAVVSYSYDDTNHFTRIAGSGWTQGTVADFDVSTADYITINAKYNSSGTTYPTDPTALTVNFS